MGQAKFVTYYRVSTKKQGATGLGLEAQRTMCQDFILREGGVCISEFQDIESGSHRGRQGLWKAIEFCRSNSTMIEPCTLVIAKLDRLARDVEFTFKVMNSGIQIRFVDMPIMNTMILGVFASVAQYERELCSNRTKSALDEIKEDIAKNGGHMSKSGRWVKGLGREKGADTSPASDAAAMSHSKRANDWRNSSSLYTWVTQQLCKRRARKDILAEAEELYERLPNVYCTREGRPLSKGVLSRWAKELKLC